MNFNQIAGRLFGSGLLDPELEKRMTEQQRQELTNSAGLDAGLATLAASGPSPYPTSLGQVLAQGVMAGRGTYAAQAQTLQKQMAEKTRAEQEAQFFATLTPENQRLAQVLGVGPYAQMQAAQTGKLAIEREKAALRAPNTSSYYKTATDMGLAPGTPEHAKMVRQLATQSKAPVVNVNTSGPTPFAKALATKDADTFAGWRDDAISAGSVLDQLDVLKRINNLQQGGKIGEAAAMVGQYFGADAGANYQVFTTASKNLVLEQAKNLKGSMSDRDIALLEDSLGKYGNDPRANVVVLDILTRAAQLKVDNYKQADSYVSEHGSLRGFQPLMRAAPSVMPTDAGRVDLNSLSAEDIEAELRRRGGGR